MQTFHRLSQKYFACMVDYHHPLRHLITYVTLTAPKKFLMKGPCVIFCGLTLMIDAVGVFLLEALDIPSDRYFLYIKFLFAQCIMPVLRSVSTDIATPIISGYIRAVQSYQ